jgi:hypothetical protein
MPEKMHEIEALGNRKFSDSTIAEALKKHCDVKVEKRWLIARDTSTPPRTLLHLAQLPKEAKQELAEAIKCNTNWISFCDDGSVGAYSNKDGLSYYGEENTEILV